MRAGRVLDAQFAACQLRRYLWAFFPWSEDVVSCSGLRCCKWIVLHSKQANMFSNQLARLDGWLEVQSNHCCTYIINDWQHQ